MKAFFSTSYGDLTSFYLDHFKYKFKLYLDPEKSIERSALGNIIPRLCMSEENQEKLEQLFIRLDRINETCNLTEIFKRAEMNIYIPK